MYFLTTATTTTTVSTLVNNAYEPREDFVGFVTLSALCCSGVGPPPPGPALPRPSRSLRFVCSWLMGVPGSVALGFDWMEF